MNKIVSLSGLSWLVLIGNAAPPAVPTEAELVRAASYDIGLDSMIGNHGPLGSEWTGFWRDQNGACEIVVKIVPRGCSARKSAAFCRFGVERTYQDVGKCSEKRLDNASAACSAPLRWESDVPDQAGWQVVHVPGKGHSRTRMKCQFDR
jgi:hypothetical protein